MTRYYLAALLVFASQATFSYVVRPLPNSTPQQADLNVPFPAPIGVQVTTEDGRPVAGAVVTWSIDSRNLAVEAPPIDFASHTGCSFNLLGPTSCVTRTDSNGSTFLSPIYGINPGNHEIPASVSVDSMYEGITYISLGVEPRVRPAHLEFVSGQDQRTVYGQSFVQPFAARLTRADGTPLGNARVGFRAEFAGRLALGSFNPAGPEPNVGWSGTTDGNGLVQTAIPVAGWGVGRGVLNASYFDADANAAVRAAADFHVTTPRGDASVALQDMWWSGPEEAGTGVAIAQHGNRLFAILFAYDDLGNPTWYSMSDNRWLGGVGNQASGGAQSPKGTPYFAYDASKLGLYDGRFGSGVLSFKGENQATLRLTLGSRTMEKSLRRFDFSKETPSPIQGVGDLWWGGPSQNGWGLSIMEQKGGLFSMWFTYDENGQATWFVMSDGTWTTPTTYEGRMARVTSSAWFGVPYDVSKYEETDVGPYKLEFTGPNAATFDYSVNGRTGRLSLSRTPFGGD